MNPIFGILLRRLLMTLGAIFVWKKTLPRGRANGEKPSMPDTNQHTAGIDGKSPIVKPD
jgi:hypothetical protein